MINNTQTRDKMRKAMLAKGWKPPQLAEAIGRSRSWVNKLLDEKKPLENIPDSLIDPINEELDIQLRPILTTQGVISTSCLRLSKLSEDDPVLASHLESLLTLVERSLASEAFATLDAVVDGTLAEMKEKSSQGSSV